MTISLFPVTVRFPPYKFIEQILDCISHNQKNQNILFVKGFENRGVSEN